MGLFGSEYWTYVLPRRVGQLAAHVADRGVPARSAPAEALRIGLADEVLPGSAGRVRGGRAWTQAARLARRPDYDQSARRQTTGAGRRRAAQRPLEAYRVQELAEMSRDIFDDRHGFAAARRAFVTKQRRQAQPDRDERRLTAAR